MSIKFARFGLLALLAATSFGCSQQGQPGNAGPASNTSLATPDGAIAATMVALRNNNIGALLESAMPPAALVKLKADWHDNMNKDPVTDQQRKDFAEHMAKLTAPDAEAQMYAEIEPKLKEFNEKSAQQMPMMIAMGQGFAQSTIKQSKDLNDQQKQQAEALLDATAKWAQTTKFTDPALVKGAIAVVCKTARELNLKTIDEARALTFDQGMQKAGIVVAGLKQVLAVYGLDMNKALDSVKVTPVSTTGDTAKVTVAYTAFDQPFSTEADLVKVDGKWYGKHAIEQWQKAQQKEISDAAAKAATPADAAPAQPADGGDDQDEE
ncbi:MAG TPA: hypothetical protein VFN13_11725 [Rudaea sp.]|nr:hypothetical protein [Rudaea sp.]